MKEFIDIFKYKAKRVNLVQSRILQMNKMKIVEKILEDPICVFVFPELDKINSPVLRLDNADLGYNGKIVVEKINIGVNMTSRITLVDVNCCGKTTLLKRLFGILKPMRGLCYMHAKLRIGLFKQHNVNELDFRIISSRRNTKILFLYRNRKNKKLFITISYRRKFIFKT